MSAVQSFQIREDYLVAKGVAANDVRKGLSNIIAQNQKLLGFFKAEVSVGKNEAVEAHGEPSDKESYSYIPVTFKTLPESKLNQEQLQTIVSLLSRDMVVVTNNPDARVEDWSTSQIAPADDTSYQKLQEQMAGFAPSEMKVNVAAQRAETGVTAQGSETELQKAVIAAFADIDYGGEAQGRAAVACEQMNNTPGTSDEGVTHQFAVEKYEGRRGPGWRVVSAPKVGSGNGF